MSSGNNGPSSPSRPLANQKSFMSHASETTVGPDTAISLRDMASQSSMARLMHDGDNTDVESARSRPTTGRSHKLESPIPPVPPLPANLAVDPDVVDFDGDQDPTIPTNWPRRKKWLVLFTLSMLTLVTPLASSMLAPGVPQILEEFGSTDSMLGSFIVSIYILGYAFGPLVIAPMSELYGRAPLYNVTNVLFAVFTIACGFSTSLSMLLGFRFLQGISGSAAITMGGGSCADLFAREERGRAIAIWSLGPLLGPVIGPIGGGFLCQALGWRWVFWVIAIAMGVLIPAMALVCHESYAPILLQHKVRRLRKQTGNPALRSKLDKGLTPGNAFAKAIIRPTKMLFLCPIVTVLATYTAIVYGYLYLLFTTVTMVFEEGYGWSASIVGLSFLGLGVGMLIGLFIFMFFSDRIMRSRAAAAGGELKPEYRLVLVLPGAIAVPAGFFIYGWTSYYQVHWIAPELGLAIIGLGMMGASMPIQTYVVDAFSLYAASATAAIAIWRSVVGALLPLAGPPMYAKLGVGWGNSLLGFVSLALVAVPVLLSRYGERIRTNPKFQPTL